MSKDYGRVVFRNARCSGIMIDQLGSGQFDHLGFFGLSDTASAVEVGSHQDTTWIVNSEGAAPASGEYKLTNCKWTSATTVRISGLPEGPYDANIDDVNVFNPAALATYPSFPNQSSGTLMIEYFASGVSEVLTYNAKLYAYDATGAITDAPPDVNVLGFEINASGQWYTGQSGVWVSMAGQGSPLYFMNHSAANGWIPKNHHIWVAGISCKANSVGVLDDWNLCFQFQFA